MPLINLSEILLFSIVGFCAQMIDGCLGMAYGVSSNTFLLSLGVSPAVASASIHTAEVFTTAVSGLSHMRFGNIDRNLFQQLVIPGILGGVMGALILVRLPTDIIKPVVSAYLLLIGINILLKARKGQALEEKTTALIPLGLAGGFLDAIGGGGWGPIVTTTLLARGKSPRKAIGSVNASEFFVTLAEAVVFITTIGFSNWQVILGLLLGGAVAAPSGAYLCKRMNPRVLMVMVGILIILLSIRTLILAFQ